MVVAEAAAGPALIQGAQKSWNLYDKWKRFKGDIENSRHALSEHDDAIKHSRRHRNDFPSEYDRTSGDEMDDLLGEQEELHKREEALLHKDERRGRVRYVATRGAAEARGRSISRVRSGTQKIDRARTEHTRRAESR